MSWDGTSFKTYVNGDLKITKTDGTTILATASTPLTMGCNPPLLNCFNGYFDELHVWNVDRSAADIKANYNKPSRGTEAGLVGYWKFNEATGAQRRRFRHYCWTHRSRRPIARRSRQPKADLHCPDAGSAVGLPVASKARR